MLLCVLSAVPPCSYSAATGNVALANCSLCDDGQYCNTSGLLRPTGVCDAGHYCRFGVTLAAPTAGPVLTLVGSVSVSLGGGVCPAGYVCAVGTGAPVPCAAGTHNPLTGVSGACGVCPKGYYCPGATAEFAK